MAMAEDAASVLEQFVQDVANLPAEIVHLLEEIEAKDRIIQECRNAVNSHDSSIQKFIKLNGAGQVNPKEDVYCKTIISNLNRAQTVQEEKVCLSEKAAHLLDRQLKRLDLKIRDLQNDNAISIDPQLPSLLNTSTVNTRLPPFSINTTGASTPLQSVPGNAVPSTAIPNAPLPRLAHPVPPPHRHSPPLSTTVPLSTNSPILHRLVTGVNPTANPTPSSLLNPRLPPRSPSTDPSKRRRLNPSIPQTSSQLRQTSLGPGTPKTQHPLATISRGSSAGPRPASKKPSRPPHHQRIGHLNPSSNASHAANKKPSRRRAGKKAGAVLGNGNSNSSSATVATAGGHLKPSPSDTGEESALSEVEGENDGSDGGDDDGEGEGDDRKYCTCRSVSYGNMVACDNDECPYEWFHWSCVGMTKEPAGKWYCEECRGKM